MGDIKMQWSRSKNEIGRDSRGSEGEEIEPMHACSKLLRVWLLEVRRVQLEKAEASDEACLFKTVSWDFALNK